MSADLNAAMRLVDAAKACGFAFERTGTGEESPLRGKRETVEFVDEIALNGFSNSCEATRRRRYSLVVPGGWPVIQRVTGDAITVLHTVVTEWGPRDPPCLHDERVHR